MTNNVSNQSEESQWSSCRPGMLSSYAASVKPTSSAGTTKIAGLSLAVACGIVVLFFSSKLLSPSTNTDLPFKGGLTCVEVMDSMPRYFDDSMTNDTHLKTNKHLVDCPPCRVAFEAEAKSRGIKLQLAACDYSPAMPNRRSLYSSLAVVNFRR